jgi:cellulose biosynthesis protein BcsQ
MKPKAGIFPRVHFPLFPGISRFFPLFSRHFPQFFNSHFSRRITAGIIHHSEGADLLPANNGLTGVELALVQTMGRESVLRQYIEMVKPSYDYIIMGCSPTLGLLQSMPSSPQTA